MMDWFGFFVWCCWGSVCRIEVKYFGGDVYWCKLGDGWMFCKKCFVKKGMCKCFWVFRWVGDGDFWGC